MNNGPTFDKNNWTTTTTPWNRTTSQYGNCFKKKRKILFLGKSVMKTFETSLCQ